MRRPPQIATIGSGRIGAELGRAWAKKGHHIVFAVRDPSDPDLATLLRETGARAEAVSVACGMPMSLSSRVPPTNFYCGDDDAAKAKGVS